MCKNVRLATMWPSAPGMSSWVPLQTFTPAQEAVKAVAWCLWQSNVLATGRKSTDGHIHI